MRLITHKTSSILLIASLLAGCSLNNAGRGGAVGVGVNRILVGAALGGTAGAAIGHYMDKQAAEIRDDLKDAKVERIGEGIKITFASGILFDTDSAALKGPARTNIIDLSKTMNKYSDTEIVVQGYTDSTGSADHNLLLSQRRAESVSGYMKSEGVRPNRISTAGFGQESPVSENTTADGRQANRRVEVAIFADNKLKRAAQDGRI